MTRDLHADLETYLDAEERMPFPRHAIANDRSRFATPGDRSGNRATAQTFKTHALLSLRAAQQNLRRAETDLEGSTGKARGMVGMAIAELEGGMPAGQCATTEPAPATDEEE